MHVGLDVHNGHNGYDGYGGYNGQHDHNSHDKFTAPGLGKVWFFQKTFCWLTLAWSFTLSNADIRFAGREFVWMTYTAADNQADGTFQSERTCGCGPRGLWLNLAVQVSSIRDSVLEDKNVPVTVPAEYSDHTDVSSPDSTAELPERTGINDHLIGLVDKPPPYDLSSHPSVLQYCSSARKTVAFNCVSEVLVTWTSRTGTCCLWLRLYSPGRSINSDRKFAF